MQKAKELPYLKPSNLILGSFPDFQRDPLTLLEDSRKLGDVVRMRFANRNNIVMHHPDAVQDVLVKKAKYFHKDEFIRGAFEPFIGNGLTISEDDHWKKQRKLLAPAFHTQRIQHYADIMIEQTHKLLAQWQATSTRDVQNDMVFLTTGIVGLSLFGDDASTHSQDVSHLLTQVNRLFIDRAQQVVKFPEWMPTQHNRELKEVVTAFDEILMGFIHERQKKMEDTGDLLSMLLLSEDAEGNRMSDQDIRNEAMTIFLGGNDTTASAMTWTLYMLSQYPDVVAKIRQEIEAIAPKRDLTFDDLRQLRYLDAVLHEVQRICPVSWAFSRECIEDCDIMGYSIPAKSIVTLTPWVMHRDPTWWDNPLTFTPERFLTETDRPKYAYFPFGGGPRVCIGSNFALMEMRLVIGTLIRHMDVRYTDPIPPKPQPLLVTQPDKRVQLEVSPRQHS